MVAQVFYYNGGFMTLILIYPEDKKKLIFTSQLYFFNCRQSIYPLNIIYCYFIQKQIVLVIYCSTTNNLKLSNLKHHIFIAWVSVSLESRLGLAGSSALGSLTRFQPRCWHMQWSHPKIWLGKKTLASLLALLMTGLNSLWAVWLSD